LFFGSIDNTNQYNRATMSLDRSVRGTIVYVYGVCFCSLLLNQRYVVTSFCWNFDATTTTRGTRCGRSISAGVPRTGSWSLNAVDSASSILATTTTRGTVTTKSKPDTDEDSYEGSILGMINEGHRVASLQSPFAVEPTRTHTNTDVNSRSDPEFNVIRRPQDGSAGEGEVVGVQTKTVVIPQECIGLIRSRAHAYWEQQQQQSRSLTSNEGTDSRFTLQFEGNSEVHLADLCDDDGDELKRWIDGALVENVYPLVRASFAGVRGMPTTTSEDPPPLCVYDALVVRYDADRAIKGGRKGASQPLVRAVGCVLRWFPS